MKCPVCGHKVRPSKKYPGKYLCDTCRKRYDITFLSVRQEYLLVFDRIFPYNKNRTLES